MQRYNASITREPFLFYEMHITAGLMAAGLSEKAAVGEIVSHNLFQYPTERSIAGRARACVRRLSGMDDPGLVAFIGGSVSLEARQAALYAWMVESRLVREFMLLLIGRKYKMGDYTFSLADVSAFFFDLQEQNDQAASWSESTIKKIRQVLVKTLTATGYLDNTKAERLQQVWLTPFVKKHILAHGHSDFLPAFHCSEEE